AQRPKAFAHFSSCPPMLGDLLEPLAHPELNGSRVVCDGLLHGGARRVELDVGEGDGVLDERAPERGELLAQVVAEGGGAAARDLEREYAERADDDEVDLGPGLVLVPGQPEGMDGIPVGRGLVAQATVDVSLGAAVVCVLPLGGDHNRHYRIPSKNPIPVCPGAPTSSARSRKVFISSQLVSGSSAQLWQAARFSDS